MNPTSNIFRWLAVGSVVASLSVPGPTEAASDAARVRSAGKLVMITALSGSGEILRNRQEKGGAFGGVDQDLAEGFAKHLGVRLENRVTREFADLIPELDAGRGDLVAATMTITEERRKKADFSSPYMPNRIVVVGLKEMKVGSLADLAGKRTLTIKGTTFEKTLSTIPGVVVSEARISKEFFEQTSDGRVDFFLGDGAQTLLLLDRYPKLAIVYTLPEKDAFGIAFRKGSDLAPLFDSWLKAMRTTGELENLWKRYYGEKALATLRSWW